MLAHACFGVHACMHDKVHGWIGLLTVALRIILRAVKLFDAVADIFRFLFEYFILFLLPVLHRFSEFVSP